ncbi:MAG: molybdopterin-dependent oxidoreductase, partial [Gammaproteobacteria bacterium]|nr:molybdopterin-dependent oxidoreductase [Gammaproteobacteria bacterium]
KMNVNRRSFLKMLGWGGAGTALAGCDLPTTVTLEEGKEEVVSYLIPEEFAIPGLGVWYASTCGQCEAGCGIHGRVREGRVLKVEGNPDSPINHGKTCMMGQGGVQAHFNPDRITAPLMRKGGSLQAVSWDEAMSALNSKLGSAKGNKVAFVSGTVSGHQSKLIDDLMDSVGSKSHYVHETVNASVWQQVCADWLGDDLPKLQLDKANSVLSFGADFLATWISPVHFPGEYAKFRRKESRGVLIQVESKMTLTGGSADLWVNANPGTEGALALGIANFIVDRGWAKVNIPGDVRNALKAYDLDSVSSLTGVETSRIKRIASLLTERAPSLVLAGASASGHEKGYESVEAAMLLNVILGNVGTTIEPSKRVTASALRAKQGNTRSVVDLAKALESRKHSVVFFYNSNPVFTAPESLRLKDGLANVDFKVALSAFPDETTVAADLVLPIRSYLEDWGTHVAAYSGDDVVISMQQPLMEPLHKETKGFGDIMISLLRGRDKNYASFNDYYGYIQTAMLNMPATVISDRPAGKKEFWEGLLQTGQVKVRSSSSALKTKLKVPAVNKDYKVDAEYPYHLVPSARLGLWDGRHANIPWLQEAPDQITKVVWGSWAEMHPTTAAKLGVKNGDYVQIASESGSVETQVYIHKGINKNAIAVPMGQGHEAYGRYAKRTGVNPLKLLSGATDGQTGELATHATRVKVASLHRKDPLVRMGGNETQLGRKFVQTISASQLRRTSKAEV